MDAKLKVIECSSDQVERRAKQFAALKDGEEVLDSEHIRHVSDLESSLASVGSKMANQVQTVAQ